MMFLTKCSSQTDGLNDRLTHRLMNAECGRATNPGEQKTGSNRPTNSGNTCVFNSVKSVKQMTFLIGNTRGSQLVPSPNNSLGDLLVLITTFFMRLAFQFGLKRWIVDGRLFVRVLVLAAAPTSNHRRLSVCVSVYVCNRSSDREWVSEY